MQIVLCRFYCIIKIDSGGLLTGFSTSKAEISLITSSFYSCFLPEKFDSSRSKLDYLTLDR